MQELKDKVKTNSENSQEVRKDIQKNGEDNNQNLVQTKR